MGWRGSRYALASMGMPVAVDAAGDDELMVDSIGRSTFGVRGLNF